MLCVDLFHIVLSYFGHVYDVIDKVSLLRYANTLDDVLLKNMILNHMNIHIVKAVKFNKLYMSKKILTIHDEDQSVQVKIDRDKPVFVLFGPDPFRLIDLFQTHILSEVSLHYNTDFVHRQSWRMGRYDLNDVHFKTNLHNSYTSMCVNYLEKKIKHDYRLYNSGMESALETFVQTYGQKHVHDIVHHPAIQYIADELHLPIHDFDYTLQDTTHSKVWNVISHYCKHALTLNVMFIRQLLDLLKSKLKNKLFLLCNQSKQKFMGEVVNVHRPLYVVKTSTKRPFYVINECVSNGKQRRQELNRCSETLASLNRLYALFYKQFVNLDMTVCVPSVQCGEMSLVETRKSYCFYIGIGWDTCIPWLKFFKSKKCLEFYYWDQSKVSRLKFDYLQTLEEKLVDVYFLMVEHSLSYFQNDGRKRNVESIETAV